ncbi:alpha-glucosidase [Cysteiniphilum halobium]|uniref:alpha-glucosidase n=1 Tax=Cysteiniphilum halobium TaxID=2219059 RepID=UPI000E65C7B0|nr:alpha-glucosidase [Cysteiniphilum halobium]
MIAINEHKKGFTLQYNGQELLQHTENSPLIFLGVGEDNMDMYRGNFDISDYLIERFALRKYSIIKTSKNHIKINFSHDQASVKLEVQEKDDRLYVNFSCSNKIMNRFWIRIHASQKEKVYGCGEQLSYFNLRGKHFPLWTSEPGVGRDKSSYVTWQADVKDKAGGDYYNTNYPQSTFISTKKYYCHMQSTAYMDFDFRHHDFHELQCWEVPEALIFEQARSYAELVEKLSGFFGRQKPLPEWVYNGIILGIQDGTEIVINKAKKALNAGVKVSGIWAQDWQGERRTSFGKRLNWNWQWDKALYPDLDKKIHELKKEGIRFLGYINPYLIQGHALYNEAFSKGYFATKDNGSEYVIDFGEFYCGVIDFTNPEAFSWYKDRVIRKEMIDFGLSGWMADFGEYLPVDCKLYNNKSAKIMHNDWPRLWAKANFEAVEESGQSEEIMYFMRAGFNGFQPYNRLLWAGDQCVDFSMHDGLASVIPAALSSGLSGMGLHHSDIGGYTTLHGLKRNKELFMRWSEMAAFTPVMRTHEGNRPQDNFQFDQDENVLKHLAKMVNTYVHLKPYIKSLVKENAAKGIPVQRPLFMHYENDEVCYDIQYQYLLGKDILVAPVYKEHQKTWEVYLPEDKWIHAYSKEEFTGGYVTVDAPLGRPPVFYRKEAEHAPLFEEISNKFTEQ